MTHRHLAMELINTEQSRLQANIEKVPMATEVYKRYLKKFDDQETELETQQAKIKEINLKMTKLKAELVELLTNLKAEYAAHSIDQDAEW